MNQIFTKLRMPMPSVIVTVGVGVALASLSLEASWGQRCDGPADPSRPSAFIAYKCGSWWQVVQCDSQWNSRQGECEYRYWSCCEPDKKRTVKAQRVSE
jgi:hypothetical protein